MVSLGRQKDKDGPETPKILKDLPIIKWVEAFKDHLHCCIEMSYNPLAYIVCDEVNLLATAPPLTTNQPYSSKHGLIKAELIARASHDDALFRDDNAQVYFKLEEATRGTQYADAIKPFQQLRNGQDGLI